MMLLLAMAVTGVSVIGYVALSLTVNGFPPLKAYPGWVAVLEPVNELSSEHVLLKVQSDAVGGHPLVSYSVVACGSHPYTADLLIGGAARLDEIQPFPSQFAALSPPLQVQRLPHLVLGYGGATDYGSVQLIHVSLPSVPCAPGTAGQNAGGFDGATEGVEGLASAPIQQSWRGPWGWWHGPHAAQAWPLTGALPQTTASGVFTGLSGLSGQWVRPDAAIEISTLSPSLDQTIDSAIPAPSDPEVASWTGTDGMNPVARLTTTSSAALLQDWIVVFAVGLGIGGSMLASLLFEWLRPHPDQAAPTSAEEARDPPRALATPRPTPPGPGPGTRRIPVSGPLIAAAIIIWVTSRWARRPRGRPN